jgi:hypothetical protein
VQKNGSKTVNFLQFLLKTHSFLQINANKCKFLLIFTPIFTLKTNKSYKITLFTITNHPNFQNSPQNPLIFDFFIFFYLPFSFLPCRFYAKNRRNLVRKLLQLTGLTIIMISLAVGTIGCQS